MVQIVNGYVCQTSCDVSAALAGHDPKNPQDDPAKAAQLAEKKALASGKTVADAAGIAGSTSDVGGQSAFAVEAVSFGGRLSGLSVARGSAPGISQLIDRLA